MLGLVAIIASLVDTIARLLPPSDPYPVGLALSLVGAAAGGLVLAVRSGRPLRDALLLAGLLLGIGLVSVPALSLGAAADPRNIASATVRFTAPALLLIATWLARTAAVRSLAT